MAEQIVDKTLIYVGGTIAVVILAVVVIWLALRPIRLWYWKKNAEFRLLQRIEIQLSDQVNATEDIYLKVSEMGKRLEADKKKDKSKTLLQEETTKEIEETQEVQEVQPQGINLDVQEEDRVIYSKKGTAFDEKELYDIIKF